MNDEKKSTKPIDFSDQGVNMSEKKERDKIAESLIQCFQNGGKLLLCGNGGSAAQSQHWAAEFVGKFEHIRRPLPAIALTVDTSALTAISNDWDFDYVFERQVEALGKEGDVLIGISTSGKSENVLVALERAKEMGLIAIDFPRRGNSTSKIQEYQLKLMHNICRKVEEAFL